MTAPDTMWHPRNKTMFDVGRLQQLDHEDIAPKIAHVMGNQLQALAGGCQSGFCKVGASRCIAEYPLVHAHHLSLSVGQAWHHPNRQ